MSVKEKTEISVNGWTFYENGNDISVNNILQVKTVVGADFIYLFNGNYLNKKDTINVSHPEYTNNEIVEIEIEKFYFLLVMYKALDKFTE